MELIVRAIPIKDIITDLAKHFKVPVDKDGNEYMLKLPKEIGEGMIRGSNYKSGIGIIQYDCTFFTDVQIHFIINKIHPLKFIFCSNGRIQHSFQNDKKLHEIKAYQNIIVSSHDHNGHVLYFKENEVVRVSSLEIDRQQFLEHVDYSLDTLHPRLQEVIENVHAEKSFLYSGNYSIGSANIIEAVRNKKLSGALRLIFLEGKTFDMLSKQLTIYENEQREEKRPQMLRQSDLEKVKQAADIIANNLDKNLAVEYLAKEVGTNVNKLQEGFRYTFDHTVNKHSQQLKLEAATEMLDKTDLNISEIVQKIGLNNRSYFAKIFREKYGVSPKYFLKNKCMSHGNSSSNDSIAGGNKDAVN